MLQRAASFAGITRFQFNDRADFQPTHIRVSRNAKNECMGELISFGFQRQSTKPRTHHENRMLCNPIHGGLCRRIERTPERFRMRTGLRIPFVASTELLTSRIQSRKDFILHSLLADFDQTY